MRCMRDNQGQRALGVQKVSGSNPDGPTMFRGAKTKGETHFQHNRKENEKDEC